MKELIEALTIFSKYTDTNYPTNCEHDVLYVCVDPTLVSDEDKARLEELGFNHGNDSDFTDGFYSYKYGSC